MYVIRTFNDGSGFDKQEEPESKPVHVKTKETREAKEQEESKEEKV